MESRSGDRRNDKELVRSVRGVSPRLRWTKETVLTGKGSRERVYRGTS